MAFEGRWPSPSSLAENARRWRAGSSSSGDGERNLDAIAGGKDHGLRSAQVLQFVQRVGKRVFGDGQFLAQVDGRGLMAESCEQQLHWIEAAAPVGRARSR